MPPHETPASLNSNAPKKGTLTRYALPLVLLVGIIGGIAYLGQYLRDTRPKIDPAPSAQGRELVIFERTVAQWDKDEAKNFKEFEPLQKGHYDFPFRNISGQEVELGLKSPDCDCASVLACVLPIAEWERLKKFQDEQPGAPLPYAQEPEWYELSADPKIKPLPLKPDAHGMVRARWNARKAPGQALKLKPRLWSQPAGNPNSRMPHESFTIPGTMTLAVRVSPARVNVGVLNAREVGRAEFAVWSPTRAELDLQFDDPLHDPLLHVETTLLSPRERGVLEQELFDSKILSHVLTGYHVTVTLYEQKDGRQLDQGAFLRKLLIVMNGIPEPDLPGPEITGRVQGDVMVGGSQDQGRIRFHKSLDARAGGSKVVTLATDARVLLEPYMQHPLTLEVELKRDRKQSSAERSLWQLKVIVPPNTFAGSFSDADAVTLRIVNDPQRLLPLAATFTLGQLGLDGFGSLRGAASFFLDQPRFVRIPLEGHVGG